MDSLGRVGSWGLDKFHGDYLNPKEEFLRKARRAIECICEFLKTRCFQDAPRPGIKVLKVVKGGSLGKGTSMKNGTADLKLFVNIFNLYTEQEKVRVMIIREIARWLEIWQEQQPRYLLERLPTLFLDLVISYSDQEKVRKMITEETVRRIEEWQKQPYLLDADLELLSNIFKSYSAQEKNWKMLLEEIARGLSGWFSSEADQVPLLNLIRSYTAKEKDQKKILEETERRVSNRQVKPYLSDADLVLFLDIFKSYMDQEKDRKMIIEEIESRLKEWQQEPYLPEVDVGLLLDLLKSYGDQEKDPKKITQKIEMWICECKRQLCMSEADLVPLRNLLERYVEKEKDRKMIIKDIARWRNPGCCEWDLPNGDLGLLLVLLNRYTDKVEDQKRITEEIVRWFNECKENMHLELIFEKSKWSNPRVLQFKLRSKETEDFIDFDILPAYDALGHYDGSMPNPQIYVDLINYVQQAEFSPWFIEPLKNFIINRPTKSGEFSPCFTELQKDFIVHRDTKLKSLIRLVKHWYNEVKEKPFPPKYALELLTVYAWEQGSKKPDFNTDEGFRTVLWLIEHYKEIRIYWTKYYGFQNEIIKQYLQKQLCKTRPVILDPADPTANLGEAEGWDRLAKKARCYASMNCCRKRDGSLVEPWDVPLAKEVPWEEGGSYCTLS